MDPASASVAFIGFAASLTTLAGLVVDSVQTLSELRRRLIHAPEELERLLSVLRQHKSILLELRDRIRVFTPEELPAELRQFWEENNTQMAADYARLKEHAEKIRTTFQETTITKKSVRA
ncbi:Pyrroline-5-carboxylate [Fonsecaea monophora]|uniref:Pyrroline-5-carboxylate n=1 Tax=Fonsecaea monophora TaxID=254056 RepID=A0A177F5D9_9EURO|nr:Pyrroline-5-carboxylate [Fonsecaea monophora]OAG39453.1 Pyrroline-5-carboxylate [Fonsecaea monophora]